VISLNHAPYDTDIAQFLQPSETVNWCALTEKTLSNYDPSPHTANDLPGEILMMWRDYFNHPDFFLRIGQGISFAETHRIRPLVAELYYATMILNPDWWTRMSLTNAQLGALTRGWNAHWNIIQRFVKQGEVVFNHSDGCIDEDSCQLAWDAAWDTAVSNIHSDGHDIERSADLRGFLATLVQQMPDAGSDLYESNNVDNALMGMSACCWPLGWIFVTDLLGNYRRVNETLKLFGLA
jgi:hypothetical protein